MSLFSNNINITGTNNFNPFFTWQVGLDDNTYPISDLRFRATIRPLTDNESFNRLPSSEIYYEETGIILNTDNLGSFNFSLEKNISSIHGPLRDYQLVIEAHDLQGNTSAGNKIGEDETNSWNVYPFGYDVISVQNPRMTGVELSQQLLTQLSGNGNYITGGNGYESRQFIGPNGEVVIRFTSGSFDIDLAGAFIYTSYMQFPKTEVLTGDAYWMDRVQKTRVSFDPRNSYIYSPNAAFDIRGIPQGYVSISVYDKIDEILLDNGVDISSGLYLSNQALIYGDAAAGSISLGGSNTLSTIVTSGNPDLGRTKQLIGSGTEIIRTFAPPNITGNIEAVTTTILYMSIPVTNFYTGANGQIVMGNPYIDNGGLGGNAISFPYGNKNPGGFPAASLVAMTNGTLKRIDQIQIGDTVKSWFFHGFDYRSDNWESVSGADTNIRNWSNGLAAGQRNTGVVTKIHINPSDNYVEWRFNTLWFSGSPLSFYLDHYNIFYSKFNQINNFSVGNEFQIATHLPTSTLGSVATVNIRNEKNYNQSLYHLEVEPFKTFYIASQGGLGDRFTGILIHDAILNYR